ncbi:(d)CMP kinase [Acinetobacter larvae]|uniref:Cytidylate kinase n=1 Tax=Acinetobacter larvae TaxID=1789224 RepID=A0A1B2LYF7_9GAMM|nr:(d)CMP kinase [Acinetobacter larvae]AOA57971.1 cytidylate kinase [Acinetobacter larvae]
MTVTIITIDGPSGSGKGTLAAKLAQHYQFHLLDSGALYRLLGLALSQQNLLDDLDDLHRLQQSASIAQNLNICFLSDDATTKTRVLLNDIEVTEQIRTEQVGEYASRVAAIPVLREALYKRQRDFAQAPGLIADGRDMATTIFPEAQVKIFLTASAQSRAERRVKQLRDMGMDVNICTILANIQARDERDTQRSVAPLKAAEDAYVIDSSNLGIEAVFQQMVQYIDRHIAK